MTNECRVKVEPEIENHVKDRDNRCLNENIDQRETKEKRRKPTGKWKTDDFAVMNRLVINDDVHFRLFCSEKFETILKTFVVMN